MPFDFASSNSTFAPAVMSQFGAWMLLDALKSEARDLHEVSAAEGAEYALLHRETIVREAQHLAVWFRNHCGYEGWEESFSELSAELDRFAAV